MDKDNSFYGKCTRAVAWLLIPATLVVGGLVTAAVAPVHPQGGQAQWDEPKPAVRPVDAPVSVGDQIPTVSVEDLPKAKPEPKKPAPTAKRKDPHAGKKWQCHDEALGHGYYLTTGRSYTMPGAGGHAQVCAWE